MAVTWKKLAYEDDVVLKSLLTTADDVPYATAASTWARLAVAASRIIGKKSTGGLSALTGAEVMAILSGQAGVAFSMNSQRITTLLAPTSTGDALRKGTQLTLTEMPRATAGLFLRGKGTGSNPAYEGWTANKLLLGAGTTTAPTEIDYAASAGDILNISADTERYHNDVTYKKLKEIALGREGTYRIKFNLKTSNADETVYGRVYKNGIAIGTEQSTNSTTYVEMSEDIVGWVAGDLCQLYAKRSAVRVAYVNNFRIYSSFPIFHSVIMD